MFHCVPSLYFVRSLFHSDIITAKHNNRKSKTTARAVRVKCNLPKTEASEHFLACKAKCCGHMETA